MVMLCTWILYYRICTRESSLLRNKFCIASIIIAFYLICHTLKCVYLAPGSSTTLR
jgi:hypothetical protein